ncbi:hypothetical protein Bbelb_074150 [Branchiostoma belcheri]|nr:hypothetical protein Bbelb_074150 [Branchiostoma belcheri]
MAEDLTSDAISSVVRNDFGNHSMTEPGTETVPPSTFRQVDEDADSYISGTGGEYEHDDDEQLSTQSDAAFENRERTHIRPGDFDTYAIAYTCKASNTRIKKIVEETKGKQKTKTASSSRNDNDIHLAECGSVKNDTDTSAFNGNDGKMRIHARDPSPMYSHNTTNPYPMHNKNEVNPNLTYLQTTAEASNANPMYLQSAVEHSYASPGSTFMSNTSDDIPCTLTSADIYQQGDVHIYQYIPARNADLEDTQPKLPLQNQAAAASNNINVVSSNPLSNGIPDALNPNPTYVPNAQNPSACGCTRRRLCLAAVYTATVLVSCVVSGVLLYLISSVSSTTVAVLSRRSQQSAASHNVKKWRDDYRCGDGYTTGDGRTAECDPDSIWPCCSPANWCGNTAAHCDCAGCVDYRNTEIGDRKLEKITIGGKGKEPSMTYAYGVAVSADNEIFVTDMAYPAGRVHVFSMDGIYLRHFPTVLPDGNSYISPSAVAIGVETGYLWVLGGKPFLGGEYNGLMHAVQYSKTGQAIKKFDVQFTFPCYVPVMAIDVRNNKTIVGHGDTVKIFNPNGYLYRSFKVLSANERGKIGGVTSDSEGNILLTLTGAFNIVKMYMYSHSGVKILEFDGRDKGATYISRGICLGAFERHIIVANYVENRVDMFTRRGEFVRAIADIKNPSGIAMGPDGEMVLLSTVGVSRRCELTNFYRNGEIGDRKLEKITIGGKGKEPTSMTYAYGVAVSADNEIFVTDFAKRVHVFSMDGIYLRHFPTILPDGNSYIAPSAVAFGVEPGYLWVLGGKPFLGGEYNGLMHAVQYSKTGQAIKKFDVQFTFPFLVPVMAIDVRNNKTIVGHETTVKIFNPNGYLYRSFKVLSANERADYNNNRVDMFTSRGEFVRTIAGTQDPSGIAMGPDGEMVVTSTRFQTQSTVTIFPRHMVNP